MCFEYRVTKYKAAMYNNIRECEYTTITNTQHQLQRCAKHFAPDSIAVVQDKDSKRRVFMSKEGYEYRLFTGFVLDEKFYVWNRKLPYSKQLISSKRMYTSFSQ